MAGKVFLEGIYVTEPSSGSLFFSYRFEVSMAAGLAGGRESFCDSDFFS
jgi:hypothetical protein